MRDFEEGIVGILVVQYGRPIRRLVCRNLARCAFGIEERFEGGIDADICDILVLFRHDHVFKTY